MVLKKDGATLYATRDLATDKFRLERYPDAMIINEVGIEQELYFKQLFEVEKMLGWVKEGQRIHIRHGHYRFKDGKMSTRKGNVIWLEDIIKAAKIQAYRGKFEWLNTPEDLEILDKKQIDGIEGKDNTRIAIGALKWNDLKRNSEQEILFDWDEILNMQGNSGPYLQYAYVRTQSVLSRIKNQELRIKNIEKLEKEEDDLLRFLTQFPYMVEKAAVDFAPNVICTYLFELSQKFNLFYQKQKIIGSSNEGFRIELTRATGQVIKNGLNLLGIETVERM